MEKFLLRLLQQHLRTDQSDGHTPQVQHKPWQKAWAGRAEDGEGGNKHGLTVSSCYYALSLVLAKG